MSQFLYFITSANSLWHQNFVKADATAVLVNNEHLIQSGMILIKRLYLNGYTAKRLTDEFQMWVIS